MRSNEIRDLFLSFFESKNHKIFPSSSLVPDDPTLLFTAAGMVQFKPIFLGEKRPDYKRATTVQKCLRTTDIERVGKTARHLTFFEMLGNFSFGDYFKEDAIKWAWEFVTKQLKLPLDKLYTTIYEEDDEAHSIWRDVIGLSEDRIFRLGEDNFWSAGPTGPCGPSSEIMYDLGPDFGCGKEGCTVGCDCDRYLEIWNLVFMQFNRDENGNLIPLPKKNIDTGAGLERIARIMQGVKSNFETDVLYPIVSKVAEIAGVVYGVNPERDVSVKIIADHTRAVAFIISDGVLPSNEGRGYVLRRLLRRAVLHARLLGIEHMFIEKVIEAVVDTMKDTYPELVANKAFILRIAGNEERRFTDTLKQGLGILDQAIAQAKSEGRSSLAGDFVFRLYDTYGFPLELTIEIAEDHDLQVDEETFQNLMEEQRERARASWAGERELRHQEVYQEVNEEFGTAEFVGYEVDETLATVKAIIKNNVVVTDASEGDRVEIFLDKTPFYAEKGGQVGDKGTIATDTGRIVVEDTQEPLENVYIHIGRVASGKIHIDQQAKASVEVERRQSIRRNHTATHLLQWALRLVLGEHVKQAGSLVDADHLRFDLTHFAPITKEQLRKIEELVNSKIFKNEQVRTFITSYEFARETGAIALFDQKYGEFVRLVEVGNFSKELCGGTHVSNTSEIGLFKITSESSIGANTRRIEAVTNGAALKYLYNEEDAIKEAASLLKTEPSKVAEKITSLLQTIKSQEQQIESLRKKVAKEEIEELISEARQLNGAKIIINEVEVADMNALRSYADLLRERAGTSALLLASTTDGKVMLIAAATSDMVKAGFNAGDLIKKVAPLVGGGGGGRPDLAQAGGKKPEGIPKAFEEAWKEIQAMLKKK
ncbi:MAG: alanine--tRNA ligase [Actinomycetota bacterium]|nr:alanine--tRNA ligase [Actinomycetota bacterium]